MDDATFVGVVADDTVIFVPDPFPGTVRGGGDRRLALASADDLDVRMEIECRQRFRLLSLE